MANLDLAVTLPPEAGNDDEQQQHPSQGGDGGDNDHDDALLITKGVRHLCERRGGIVTTLPARYVLPPADRPAQPHHAAVVIPVIDLARLRAGGAAAAAELDAACRELGFFQVVNHGVDDAARVLGVARRFFEDLPSAARERYASADIRAAVRYGTSFNQRNDGVLCWRDFLKIVVRRGGGDDEDEDTSAWPDAPSDLREVVSAYAQASRRLFSELMEAALQALGIRSRHSGEAGGGEAMLHAACDEGSQMLMVNCFPACPEPGLTLGMPPHSDYGLLTVLLQDPDVTGALEIFHAGTGRWVPVDPLPGALVVNVGDQLEIYSNGRYTSALHRVRVNAARSRVSVASLHGLAPDMAVGPAAELVRGEGAGEPRRYMDTDFATFLEFLASAEGKHKSFLQSRRIHPTASPGPMILTNP